MEETKHALCCVHVICVYTFHAVNPDGFSVNHHLKAQSTVPLIYISDVHFRPFSRALMETV